MRKLPDLGQQAYMSALNHRDSISLKLSEWIYNVDPEFADIQEAAIAMDKDAEDFMMKALRARFDDEFTAVEAEQYLRKLLELLNTNPENQQQSTSQGSQGQGGEMGQSGEQGQQGGGQGGGGQFMTKEQLLRAIEQMTALQDAADSLSSRANSLARMAGINMPLSAERLFSAMQNRAMRNQQGGMQGGRQGQGGSLSDMMRQLAQMGRQGVRVGEMSEDIRRTARGLQRPRKLLPHQISLAIGSSDLLHDLDVLCKGVVPELTHVAQKGDLARSLHHGKAVQGDAHA